MVSCDYWWRLNNARVIKVVLWISIEVLFHGHVSIRHALIDRGLRPVNLCWGVYRLRIHWVQPANNWVLGRSHKIWICGSRMLALWSLQISDGHRGIAIGCRFHSFLSLRPNKFNLQLSFIISNCRKFGVTQNFGWRASFLKAWNRLIQLCLQNVVRLLLNFDSISECLPKFSVL
jgi:hypothetical protein